MFGILIHIILENYIMVEKDEVTVVFTKWES